MNTINRVIGGILLVAGTTIGAGMLVLPVVTGFAGFWPSIALFISYWLYMTFTAFLMLEVNLWMEENTNLITMAKRTLGRSGQVISWMIYLFLLYTLTTAYLAGGGPIFIEAVETLTGWQLPDWTNPFPLLILFGFFVYQGARSVDYVNRLLMLGLAISYVLMVWRGRYIQQRTGEFRVPGGQWALAIAFIISVSVISLEIANKTGILTFSFSKLEQTSQS